MDVSYETRFANSFGIEFDFLSCRDNKSRSRYREGKKKRKKRKFETHTRSTLITLVSLLLLFRPTKPATLSRSRGVLKEGWKPTPQRPVDTLLIYDLSRDSYVYTRVYRPFLTETDKQGWKTSNHRPRLLDPPPFFGLQSLFF